MATPRLGSVLQYLRGVTRPPAAAAVADASLLEQFLGQRDESAFATLVARHGPMVLGVARNVLNDAHAAEDVFQATFLVLARNVQTLRQRSSLASWLYGVAYRIALNARVRAARQRKHERRVAAMGRTDASTDIPNGDLQPLLAEELNRLPEKYRAPLILCYLQGMTNEQAAEQLQWPAGTVKGRLARAREALRGRLAKRGLAMTGVGLNAALAESALSAAVAPALLNTTVQAAAPVALGAVSLAQLAGPAAELAREAAQGSLVLRFAGVTLLVAVLAVGGAGTAWLALSPAVAPLTAIPTLPAIAPEQVASFAEADHYHGMPVPLAGSADGKRLVVLARRDTEAAEVYLQEIATGKIVASRPVQPGFRVAAADCHAVALIYGSELGDDAHAEICDLTTLKVKHDWRPEKTRVQPTEAFLTGDALVLLGGHVEEMPANAGGGGFGIGGAPFAPFGGADQSAVGVFDLTGKRKAGIHTLAAEDTIIASQLIHPAGKPALVLLLEREDVLRLDLLDPATGKARTLADKLTATALAVSGDGKTLAVQTAEQRVQLLNGTTGAAGQRCGDGDTTIVCFALSPDGQQLATAGSDRRITLWDVATGRVVKHFAQPRVQKLCFANDGKLLAAGSPEEVTVWSVGK